MNFPQALNTTAFLPKSSRSCSSKAAEDAGLLKKSDLENVLLEQQNEQYRYRLGTIAVTKGYIKSSTVDFFLKYLFPEELGSSPIRTLDSLVRSRQRQYKYYSEAMKRKKQLDT